MNVPVHAVVSVWLVFVICAAVVVSNIVMRHKLIDISVVLEGRTKRVDDLNHHLFCVERTKTLLQKERDAAIRDASELHDALKRSQESCDVLRAQMIDLRETNQRLEKHIQSIRIALASDNTDTPS